VLDQRYVRRQGSFVGIVLGRKKARFKVNFPDRELKGGWNILPSGFDLGNRSIGDEGPLMTGLLIPSPPTLLWRMMIAKITSPAMTQKTLTRRDIMPILFGSF
jgi:hypothetical protein